MTQRPVLIDEIVAALVPMWTEQRISTLARIAHHRRQFENWWKFELATFLWEFAEVHGADIFIETYDRADITVATPTEIDGGDYRDPKGAICVPVELKTIGTWWGGTASAIAKALQEVGKKRLAHDFDELANGRRRLNPCGLVGLLITDAEEDCGALDRYEMHAVRLADMFGLTKVSAREIRLPAIAQLPAARAREYFWAKW